MENVINANVEATKGNKTRVEELKKWPLGQALLKAGFKPITKEQMRERFACDAIEKRANKELKAKAEKEGKEFRDERGLGSMTATSVSIMDELSRSRAQVMDSLFVDPAIFSHRGFTSSGKSEKIRAQEPVPKPKEIVYGVECTVEHEPLNSYVQDEIPERCEGSVLLALELGVRKETLHVQYPVLAEKKQEDPIIVAVLHKEAGMGSTLMEIDFWE